jgi:hypothetical protein
LDAWLQVANAPGSWGVHLLNALQGWKAQIRAPCIREPVTYFAAVEVGATPLDRAR